MRGRVCNLLLLLVLASTVPRDSRPYFNVPILETPPTWRARSPYLYPPGTRWPRYISGHWVPMPSPLTTRRATVEVFYPASTRYTDWATAYIYKIPWRPPLLKDIEKYWNTFVNDVYRYYLMELGVYWTSTFFLRLLHETDYINRTLNGQLINVSGSTDDSGAF
jgi:hypothetical protein